LKLTGAAILVFPYFNVRAGGPGSKKPLLTSAGSLPLPKPTNKPAHLKEIEYELP
jgi:hypothetical protein